MDSYLTREQLAALFKVKPRTVSQWLAEGCPVLYTGAKRTPGKGCRPLFIPEEIEQWLKHRAPAPPTRPALSPLFFGLPVTGKEGTPS